MKLVASVVWLPGSGRLEHARRQPEAVAGKVQGAACARVGSPCPIGAGGA